MRHSFIDKYSYIDSIVHRLDSRIKIVCILMFILFVVFTPPSSFISFALYGLSISVMIWSSKIPVDFILKRSLVVIPFVLMIAMFIPFYKTGKIVWAYSIGNWDISITSEGLMIFWNIMIKSYLCTLSIIILTASTKLSCLLKALEKLKFPSLFIMIFSFMYRYIFVIQDELMVMKRAKESRSVGGSRWFNAKALANILGVLFVRTYERGENIYLAMRSRGFTGEINTIDKFRLKRGDFYFLFMSTFILAGIRILGSY